MAKFVKTQEQMYWEQHRKLHDQNNLFMEMVTHPTDPITKSELRKLIERRPALWSRFSHWLNSPNMRD